MVRLLLGFLQSVRSCLGGRCIGSAGTAFGAAPWLMVLALTVPQRPVMADDTAPSWNLVTPMADWAPRDSSGEVVYKNQLWLLGGWFDSFATPPRDVWSTPDGKNWKRVTGEAPWRHSDLPMTLVFDDKMWIMGGWYNGRLPGYSASSEVWWSTDGVEWTQATAQAGWSPRIAAGAAVFKGRMWIVGGTENYYFGDTKSLKNDVWSSADGKTWTQATANAGWAPRAYHAVVVHQDRLWVLGGGNYVPQYGVETDVWSSADGEHWEKSLDRTPWAPRLWFSSVVYRDRMWVLGGWSNHPSRNWGDVWYSKDGKQWDELKSPTVWKARHEHSAYVFQDKIWVAGGHAMPLSNEVWSLEIPQGWFND
ncbi:MAG: galactose oxidase [Planctomycetales bacterium]